MPFGIGNFIGKNSGVIGTIAGGGIGFAIGGPAGAVRGAAIGGAIGGGVQTSSNNPRPNIPSNPTMLNPATGTALVDLIRRQRNRNLGLEASRNVNAAGIGLSRGDLEQTSALRGAGRNAFGSLLREALERESTRRGEAILNERSSLERGQESALQALLAQQIGANQFAFAQASQNQQANAGIRSANNDRRDSYLNSLLGSALTLGATNNLFGLGGGGSTDTEG